jgi:hypothetical protein
VVLLWCLAVAQFGLAQKPPVMSGMASPGALPNLPFLPHSAAPLLAASHLMLVTVRQLTEGAWAAQPSGLDQRTLHLRIRLDAVLKGTVELTEGSEFNLDVPQLREPGMMISDYHGFWSEQSPQPDTQMLVASVSAGKDPAQLMMEPAIRLLAPATALAEVNFATVEESKLGARLVDPATHEPALLDLLAETMRQRQTIGILAVTYVWDRVQSGNLREGKLVAAVLDIVSAADTNAALRATFADGICDAALDQGATPAQRAALAHHLFNLAKLPAAADLFEGMVQAQLYNLIFETDAPPITATTVLPNATERSELAARLKAFDDERATEIAAWLRRG